MSPVPSAYAVLKVDVGERRIELELNNVPIGTVASIVSSSAAAVEENLPIDLVPDAAADAAASAGVGPALATVTPLTAPPKPAPAKTAKPKPVAASSRAEAPPESLVCGECDKRFASSQARGAHRRKANNIAGATAKPASPASPASSAPASSTDERELLRCDCGEFSVPPAELQRLKQHTMTRHGGRFPSSAEITPRKALRSA